MKSETTPIWKKIVFMEL